MTKRSINAVRISVTRGTIELQWQSRQKLLDMLLDLPAMRFVIDAFQAVGTSEPVALTQEQKADLIRVIEFWAERVPGRWASRSCPTAIYALRNALHDDLQDAASSSAA